MRKTISIIIPAYNEAGYIGGLLKSLSKQKFSMEEVEIIVVDNNSTDATKTVVTKFQDSNPNLIIRLISELRKNPKTGKGSGMSRNTGARVANGRILLFLDADNLVRENFLDSIYVKAVGQRYEAGTIFTLPIEKSVLGYFIFYVLEFIKLLLPIRPFGKNFVIKGVFKSVHGYREDLMVGENVDFLTRVQKFLRNRNKQLGYVKTPVYASLRRFEAKGYAKVLFQWFLGYIGFRSINYPRLNQR
ncbi:glycosyltransferase [Patescibacteria group bacterium]|nr:glycosyltransferase [Patescibacteria group bacterium]